MPKAFRQSRQTAPDEKVSARAWIEDADHNN
jgi:hypothetical protein